MKRRNIILAAVIGGILLTGLGWWISTHFERVPVTHSFPPDAQARHDRYLALERFMKRMGRTMKTTGDVRLLDKLKPGGVLILDRHHRAVMTKERLKEVFDWVGKGGYLIVVPEYSSEPDPVLSYLHVQWDDEDIEEPCGCSTNEDVSPTSPASAPAAAASAPATTPSAATDDSPALLPASAPAVVRPSDHPAANLALLPASSPFPASAPVAASAPAGTQQTDTASDDSEPSYRDTVSAHIPGSPKPLAISMQYEGLMPGDIKPAWEVPLDDKANWLLHYHYGMGNVSLIVNMDRVVSNYTIAKHDHAEFIWKLLQHYQPTGPVTLMTRLPMPDLFDWLSGPAWAASISGAALLLLWLWSIAPRFGGTAPDAPPSRRELREHLNAIGRFVWRNEGLKRWLEVARNSFRERLGIRHPSVAALPYPDQAKALAQLTGLPREAILAALTAPAGSASEFTAMLRTLKELKHNL